MQKKKGLLFLGLVFSYSFLYAQLASPIPPRISKGTLKSITAIPTQEIPAFDTMKLFSEDREFPTPFRYGICRSLEVDILKEGIRHDLSEGRVWLYKLNSHSAYSLGIQFGKFRIPEGALIHITDPEGNTWAGGYDARNNNPGLSLSLADFKGNSCIIQYFVPRNSLDSGMLILTNVVQAYRDIFSRGSTQVERINVNCHPEKVLECKHAVVRLTFHDNAYSYLCSGSLLNNIKQDGKPYLLTAGHCIASELLARNLVAWFTYELDDCNTMGIPAQTFTLDGSSLMVTDADADASLLLLKSEVPGTYQPWFAGWDASGRLPDSGFCIHHPEGEIKQIAFENNRFAENKETVYWEGGINSTPYSHFQVNYDLGETRSGSSGSPIFDEKKRIIGQLHGGDDTYSFFGKLSKAWNTGGNSSFRHYLDPDSTGILWMDAYHPPMAPEADFSIPFSPVCPGSPVKIYDRSYFDPEQWSWQITPSSFSFANGSGRNSQNPEILFTNEGEYSIKLQVSNEVGTGFVSRHKSVEVNKQLQPAFVGLTDGLTFCPGQLNAKPVLLTGAQDYEIASDYRFITQRSQDTVFLSLLPEYASSGVFSAALTLNGKHGTCDNESTVNIRVGAVENDFLSRALPLQKGFTPLLMMKCAGIEENEPYPPTGDCNSQQGWCSIARENLLRNTLWYTFEGPPGGRISIKVMGFDTKMALYQADTPEQLLSGNKNNYSLIAANDNGKTITESEIRDAKVIAGKKYWLQVDRGKEEMADSAALYYFTHQLDLFPVPTHGLCNLRLNDPHDGKVSVFVYNSQGQKVYADVFHPSLDEKLISLNLTALPQGIYLVVAETNRASSSGRLLIF